MSVRDFVYKELFKERFSALTIMERVTVTFADYAGAFIERPTMRCVWWSVSLSTRRYVNDSTSYDGCILPTIRDSALRSLCT